MRPPVAKRTWLWAASGLGDRSTCCISHQGLPRTVADRLRPYRLAVQDADPRAAGRLCRRALDLAARQAIAQVDVLGGSTPPPSNADVIATALEVLRLRGYVRQVPIMAWAAL